MLQEDLQKNTRMKMTKRHHVCDETCEPEGTGIHNVKSNAKKTRKKATKPKEPKKEIKPEVVNVYKQAPTPYSMTKIIEIVNEIANENETNKILEKTLILLRKLQKDIA